MANSGNLLFPKAGAGLPQLTWEKGQDSLQTIVTSEQLMCSMFYPRISLVDQGLIDNGELFVQFGKIDRKHYTIAGNPQTAQIKGNAIRWYVPAVAGGLPYQSSGSGEIGGGSYYGVDRPNLIPVTSQNTTLTQAVPVWGFYQQRDTEVFDARNPTLKSFSKVVLMTGKGARNNEAYAQYLPGGGRYKKRPKNHPFSGANFTTSTWFCRLVIIRDNKVVEYGPISTPLIFKPNGLMLDKGRLSMAYYTGGGPMDYVAIELRGEELKSYNG